MNSRRSRFQQGFTLIEALVVITIAGTLLMLAAPSFVTFTSGQKVKTASFDLYATMVFARSEALKRRVQVTVAANGGDWATGWTVSAAGVVDPLRNQDALSGVTTTTTSATTSAVYRQDGRLVAGPVTVLIQPQTSDASISNRCIVVSSNGLPKTTVTSGTTCP